jgi:hypothetical protein
MIVNAILAHPLARAAILLAVALATGYAVHAHTTAKAWDAGYAAAEAAQAQADAAWQASVSRLSARIAATGAEGDTRVRAVQRAAPASTRRVTDHVAAAPDFATVRRPPGLHAERVRDLDELAAAAADRPVRH